MINLIPPAAKKAVKQEYWIRVSTVWLLLWAAAVVVGGATLLPTYVLINSQLQVYSATTAAASEKVASYKDIADALVQTSNQARLIVDTARLEPFSTQFALIQSVTTSDILLLGLTSKRTASGFIPFTVSGIAKNRKALADFRDRLLAEDRVTTVDLPIANLAQDKDIMFTLTITLNAL